MLKYLVWIRIYQKLLKKKKKDKKQKTTKRNKKIIKINRSSEIYSGYTIVENKLSWKIFYTRKYQLQKSGLLMYHSSF